MRPQTAFAQKEHKKILFNEQVGNYYILNNEGKQIKVNKRGDLIPKFVTKFSGFTNFKQLKDRSVRDQALMYTQPHLDYEKENNPIHPQGTKFAGYAQFPYNLKGQIPNFIEAPTLKQSKQQRSRQNFMKSGYRLNSFSTFDQNHMKVTNKNGRKLNKFQSLRNLRTQSQNLMVWETEIDEGMIKYTNKNSSKCERKKQNQKFKQETNVIMEASYSYVSGFNQFKSLNQKHKVASSFHSDCKSKISTHDSKNSSPKRSFFQQSLSNITQVQSPNYFISELKQTLQSQRQPMTKFNLASQNTKCYKTSCHYTQYIPRRRYIKQNKHKLTTNISEYEKALEIQQNQKKIIRKLKEDLKKQQEVKQYIKKNNEVNKKCC